LKVGTHAFTPFRLLFYTVIRLSDPRRTPYTYDTLVDYFCSTDGGACETADDCCGGNVAFRCARGECKANKSKKSKGSKGKGGSMMMMMMKAKGTKGVKGTTKKLRS